jgi:DNA-binding response OmpR family regulator
MTSKKPFILSTGSDPMLLNSRKLVLEHAGFQVESCQADEAVDRLRADAEAFDGALLGQSIGLERRIEIAHEMRQLAAELAIILVYFPEDRFDASVCDAIVETPSEPEAMARAVWRALKKRGRA